MKKLKTISISFLLIGVIAITTAFVTVRAKTKEQLAEIETNEFVYTNLALLGTTELNFDFEFDIKGKSTFEYGGFKYTRDNGFTGKISSIEIVNNPEAVETIGIFDRIGNTSIYLESMFNSIDFSIFTNAKNLIIGIEGAAGVTLRYGLKDLPAIENIYYLNTSLPEIITDTTKNIFLCNGLFISSSSWSGFNFPDNNKVNYITVDAFKYTYLSYFEIVKNSYPVRDLGKLYVIPNDELPVPTSILPITPEVNYIEYGGAIYSPVKDLASPTGYLYGLVYIDPLVEKIVINQRFNNYIAKRFMVDTVYVIGDSLTQSSNLISNHMIIAYPKIFNSDNYKYKDNVYFYDLNSMVNITEDSIKNLSAKFYFPYFTFISFPNGYTYGSYTTGTLLPEIKITHESTSIDTTDLTVRVAELKAELGILDINIYGHPFATKVELPEEPGDSTLPEEPIEEEPPSEEIPPEVEPSNPEEETPPEEVPPPDNEDIEDEVPPAEVPPDVDDNSKNNPDTFLTIISAIFGFALLGTLIIFTLKFIKKFKGKSKRK